jgi:hypothetical protein
MRSYWILSAFVVNVCWFSAMMIQKSVRGLAFRSLRSRLVVGQRSALSFTPNPDTAGIHTAVEDDTSTSTSKKLKLSSFDVSASRLGLDPLSNRFHAPIVNHENYSFSDWPENHTFPVRIAVLYCTVPRISGIHQRDSRGILA